jgi:tetratricopeptide (TPR) repeat protein
VITPDEVRKFGEDIEREFRESGPDFFVNSIDVVRMVDIATAGQPGDDQTKTSFRSGASSGFHRNLAQGMERFSSYKLLRVITTNERPQLVFRCLSDEGSLNYHVLDLERNRRSRIRVVDMYVMISGEKMSETLRRAYLAIAAEADRSLLSRLTLGQGAWIKHGKDIQELARLVREGKPEAALKVYNSLPESLRTEKLILLMRLMAVSGGDEKAYLSAIEAFEKHFPNDPSLALISIDGYVLKKQPRKAIASIEKLDRFVGGDPYLLLLQAGQYVELKERDKARELARKAIEQEPSLPGTYDFLLGLALEDKNHNETARLLNLTEKNLKVNMLGAVSEAKEYEAFLDSSAGKKWKEDHQPK